jgi:hypothetical protein
MFNSSGQSLNPDFPSYQSCSWLITVQESFVVFLNLTSLYIPDCNENLLEIYDGASEASPRMKTHCGLNTLEDIEVFSTGNNIYLVLNSGNLSEHLNYTFGFEARYGPTSKSFIFTFLFNYLVSNYFSQLRNYYRDLHCTIKTAYVVGKSMQIHQKCKPVWEISISIGYMVKLKTFFTKSFWNHLATRIENNYKSLPRMKSLVAILKNVYNQLFASIFRNYPNPISNTT